MSRFEVALGIREEAGEKYCYGAVRPPLDEMTSRKLIKLLNLPEPPRDLGDSSELNLDHLGSKADWAIRERISRALTQLGHEISVIHRTHIMDPHSEDSVFEQFGLQRSEEEK